MTTTARFRPTSWKALVCIHLAFIYGGGLYVYMGSVGNPFPGVFDCIGMNNSSQYYFVVGCLSGMVGIFGLYASVLRTKNTLLFHDKLLKVLFILLLGQMGVGIYYSTSMHVSESNISKIEDVFTSEMCPTILGYTCHGAPASLIQTASMIESIPQYNIGIFSTFDYKFISNSTLQALLMIPGEPLAPISKLCDTLPSRMAALRIDVAMNLNATCMLCAKIPPVLERPSWFTTNLQLTFYPTRLPFECHMYLYRNQWTFYFYNEYYKKLEPLVRTSSGYHFFRNGISDFLQRKIPPFAKSIAISSSFFSLTVLFLLHEIRRTVQEQNL